METDYRRHEEPRRLLTAAHSFHSTLVPTQFKPGQSGNPGGSPKGTPRVDVAYKRLLAMTPAELAVWEPRNGAENMAAEQCKRACIPNARQTLNYAERITVRTDGPVVRKAQKEDVTQLEAERQRLEAAIDALVEKRGCSRADAAVVMAVVNPSYKKFIEVGEPDS
jgi:hypothetical protein